MKQLLLLLLIITTLPLMGELEISGYYKSFLTTTKYPELVDMSDQGIELDRFYGDALNALRITAKYQFHENIIGEVAYGISPRVADQKLSLISSMIGVQPAPGSFRIKDFDQNLYGKDDQLNNITIGHNLDRFALFITLPWGDLEIGRQALSFGSAKFINPTDIFSPLSFQAIDREDKYGLDIVQFRMPLGEMGELQIGYLFGEDGAFDQSGQYLRVKNNFFDYDWAVTVVHFKRHVLAGIDFAGTLKGASIWGEGAYLFAEASDDFNRSESYFRGSAGIDYYLKFEKIDLEFYLFVEYHFNGAGKSDPDRYLPKAEDIIAGTVKTPVSQQDGGVYLMGQHYLMPGIAYEITPLLKLTAQGIINLNDFSALITPILEYNIQENLYIDLGGSIPIGEESSVEHLIPDVKSEFGLYPLTIYAAMRIYF